MYSLYDYNEDLENQSKNLEVYFGEFSSEIKRRLMAKNLLRPESLYDVFYPSVKDALLSKNENKNPFLGNLDEGSKAVRDGLLVKNAGKILGLEDTSEQYRESLLARVKMHSDDERLLNSSESKRKSLTAKNQKKESGIDSNSDKYRREQLAKNKHDVSTGTKSIDGEAYRESQISKNTEKKSDLINNSKDFKDANIVKNVPPESDIENASKEYRSSNLSHNIPNDSNIENDSASHRAENVHKNIPKETNLQTDSISHRDNSMAKNKNEDANQDLKDKTEHDIQFRNDNLSRNAGNNTDLATDSIPIREQNIKSNENAKITDLLAEEKIRNQNISKNVVKESDLLGDSISYREKQLSLTSDGHGDIEKSSEEFRNDELSKNNVKKVSLEDISEPFREKELSTNSTKPTDLEKNSESFRNSQLSNNEKKESSIEKDSSLFREADLSLNVAKKSDVEKDSDPFRKNELSLNVPKISDVEKESVGYRDSVVALTVPKTTDVEKESVGYRDNVVALTVPKTTDVENDSEAFRTDELAHNVPSETSIEDDSVDFREDELAHNVPNESDLLTDSSGYLSDELAHNVPSTNDLLSDSEGFMEDELAHNVPPTSDLLTDSEGFMQDELSHNIPSTHDLLTDSEGFMEDELAHNVPSTSDLLTDSAGFMADELAHNVASTSDLLIDSESFRQDGQTPNEYQLNGGGQYSSEDYTLADNSKQFRDNNLSKNPTLDSAGVNILSPFGTSTFVGVSAVWTQGLLYRNLLLPKNKYSLSMFGGARNEYMDDSEHSRLLDNTLNVPTLSDVRGGDALPMTPRSEINSVIKHSKYPSSLSYSSPAERNAVLQIFGLDYIKQTQSIFGIDDPYGNYTYTSANYKVEKDGIVIDFKKEKGEISGEKNITTMIRDYLRYMNPFVIVKDVLSQNPYDHLSEEFATKIRSNPYLLDLINSYDGVLFKNRSDLKNSVTTPPGSNYIKGGEPQKLMDVNYGTDMASLANKTLPGNPLDDAEFRQGRKGVRYVLKNIVNDRNLNGDQAKFMQNFNNVQGTDVGVSGEDAIPKEYFIGYKDSDHSPRIVRQKFTIKNQYAPAGAEKLIFYIKNYSIPDFEGSLLFFPPYISSFQNTDSANWNTNTFLGRPEPVYTYNNSSRDGSMSFIVLTDFAQDIVLGRSQKGNMKPLTKKIMVNFTDSSSINKTGKASAEAEKTKQSKKSKELSDNASDNEMTQNNVTQEEIDNSKKKENENKKKSSVISSAGESGTNSKEKGAINQMVNAFNDLASDLEVKQEDPNYYESTKNGINVYNSTTTTSKDNDDGYQESIPCSISEEEGVRDRIDDMIQGLQFQPAYFSGSLVDFKKRMEFLARLTRPSKNTGTNSGFSFVKPPVCHIRLGDWLDHDVVINSVSYDYTDVPWTFGAKQVQPMWANVTLSFNLIGPVGGENNGVPLTSSDPTGYFGSSSV